MKSLLKVTTDYSLMQSLIKVKDLINFCISNNITFCGICDENLFGSIEFYKLCKSNNIKPIIGIDINILGSRVYLYAKNYDGYKNLLKINSEVYDSLINIELLKKYSKNIICIIPYKSISMLDKLAFYENVFVGYENTQEYNSISYPNKVYIEDIKVLNKDDLKYLNILDKLNEKDSREYSNNYPKDIRDEDYKSVLKIVDLINIEIPFNNRYIPVYNKDIDSYEFLSKLCIKGLNKRLNGSVSKEYTDRLNYELSVIKKMGFVDYFLIVYDYVLYAKKNNILVGPGRGSAAGSLVSYVIGITDIDPIKYNLLFERFLNYERVSMPDIDIDFDNTKREDVIEYVKNKYGHESVAGGITFTTYKTRLILRDVSRLLKINDNLLNKFLRVIKRDLSLKDNLANREVIKYLNSYKELKELYQISLKLEGLKKNISTHAAGIVISSIPLDEIIPMYKKDNVYLTGITMEHLESMGLLKMDFLALKNLSTISSIIKYIPELNLNNIPLDDKEVYELFKNADTDGIFQFETPSFKSMLPKFSPENFSELSSCIALVRPGPKLELDTYIKRKKGLEKVTYYHENLKSILEETYGVIVYQEQVISILVKMSSFTYAEADNIRRAMSKKKEDLILSYQDEFIKRSVKNGYSEELSLNIFKHILSFASYGFNKSHSVSYAIISYWMAYLKVHYRALFTFSILNDDLGNTSKVTKYLNDLKKENYKILNVDINKSEYNFNMTQDKIYLPFRMIKGLSSEVINKILEERKTPFKDIYDFFLRTNKILSKKDYELLIKGGALNNFYNIHTLLENLDNLINYGNLSSSVDSILKPDIVEYPEYDKNVLRENELSIYGLYITNHPSSVYTNTFKLNKIKENAFKNIVCYVIIESIKTIKTKNNEDMAFLRCSDETGCEDFTIFPNKYKLLANISQGDMIKVYGSISKRYDKYSIIINNMEVI